MTKEQLRSLINEEGERQGMTFMARQFMYSVLEQVVCPEPEKPDHLRDATEKGGDRAAEMAEMLITAFDSASDESRHVSIGMGCDGTLVRPSVRTCDNALGAIRNVFAVALRAYGDELLDKAAEAAARVAWRHSSTVVTAAVCALKSTAAKGAANG